MEVIFEIQVRSSAVEKYSSEIVSKFKNGSSVIVISKQLHLPPLAVLKVVLLSKGLNHSTIKSMVSMREPMHKDLANDALNIFRADIGSKLNSDNIFKASQLYEEFVGSHLQSLGIKFRTEEDLRKENFQLTPDFLLTSPVYINGQVINWIDAKNYASYPNRFLSQKLLKQSIKYTKAFGPGAFIFSGGITCGTVVSPDNNTLLLDGSNIEHIVSV